MCAGIVFWFFLVLSVQYFTVCPWHLASTVWKAYAVEREEGNLSWVCSFISMQFFFMPLILAFYGYPLHLTGLIYEYSIDMTGSAKVIKMLRRQMSWVTLKGKYLTSSLSQVLVLWLCHFFCSFFRCSRWILTIFLLLSFGIGEDVLFFFDPIWGIPSIRQEKGELWHCSESTRALELWTWL